MILMAKFYELKRLMGAESIADQNSWFVSGTISCLRIEHALHPAQADYNTGIASLGSKQSAVLKWRVWSTSFDGLLQAIL
jgi:hypothetical protein